MDEENKTIELTEEEAYFLVLNTIYMCEEPVKHPEWAELEELIPSMSAVDKILKVYPRACLGVKKGLYEKIKMFIADAKKGKLREEEARREREEDTPTDTTEDLGTAEDWKRLRASDDWKTMEEDTIKEHELIVAMADHGKDCKCDLCVERAMKAINPYLFVLYFAHFTAASTASDPVGPPKVSFILPFRLPGAISLSFSISSSLLIVGKSKVLTSFFCCS